jgi:hypothetical protein
MKTLIASLTVQMAIYSGLILLVAGIALGAGVKTNPPAATAATQVVFDFEEEAYIDDIPFETEAVVANYEMDRLMNETFEYEEESYVDDIPFSTELVAQHVQLEKAMNVEVEYEDEVYVDDIPFDTFRISLEYSDNMVELK